MKDYTDIFSKAIELKNRYDFRTVRCKINAYNDLKCGDWDDWADDRWYRLCPKTPCSYDRCYGFICASYPVALLTEYCPEVLKQALDEVGVLHTELSEPMCCDEEILRQYVPRCIVFDESFMDSGDFSPDDERFFWVCQKLDTGHQSYIDAGSFTMKEIR
ncbi:MAG: hypothetical protein IJ740_19480 [Ruminococcus sp.]|nr:hypothetical protein [Ruminococcus sp.]MBR1753025.1 hypothetical protein [Ruminococcus sp.]